MIDPELFQKPQITEDGIEEHHIATVKIGVSTLVDGRKCVYMRDANDHGIFLDLDTEHCAHLAKLLTSRDPK